MNISIFIRSYSLIIFRYVRCLASFYLRLIGSPVEIYTCLEPIYFDYRKIRFR